MTATETEVTSSARAGEDASPVVLAIAEHGPRDAGVHLLLLHGFPDDHTLWDPVVAQLPDDWHVVAPDNRGTGRSSRPAHRADYRLEHLVEDVVAVLEQTVPDGTAVHLVGHDWGSVLGWDLVAAATTDPRLQDRIASFTSLSGPPLDHVATLGSTRRGLLRLLPQLLHSVYAMLFCLPGLPRLVRRGQRLSRAVFGRLDPTARLLPWGPDLVGNAVPAVHLYRANAGRLGRPRAWHTSVPVQLVVASRDGFIRPRSLERLEERCDRLARVRLDQGHWLPRESPGQVARLVEDHVRACGA